MNDGNLRSIANLFTHCKLQQNADDVLDLTNYDNGGLLKTSVTSHNILYPPHSLSYCFFCIGIIVSADTYKDSCGILINRKLYTIITTD